MFLDEFLDEFLDHKSHTLLVFNQVVRKTHKKRVNGIKKIAGRAHPLLLPSHDRSCPGHKMLNFLHLNAISKWHGT